MVSKGTESVDTKEALLKIKEEEVLKRYFNISSLPAKINAPYRKDENPSLGFYISKTGRICYKDFGTGEQGSIYDLLSKMWHLSFQQTIKKLLQDNIVSIGSVSSTKSIPYKKKSRSSTSIKVKVREWQDWDFSFWESYGISLPWLKFGDVHPISTIFFYKDNKLSSTVRTDKYAYCYVEKKDGIITYKIYQPFNKTFKWLNSHDSSVWDLWAKLPKEGDKLIITSSRKDALTLWENTGIPSTCMQGEAYQPKQKIINQLKSRFKKIYVLFDNDFQSEENWGRIDAQKLCKEFGLIQLEIPEDYQSKDPSDLVKNHGRKALYDLIKQLIK